MHTGRHRRSVFRRMHVVVALVVAGLLAVLLPNALAPKAKADPGDWAANVQAADATELAATPNGVYALHCSSSNATHEASFHAASTGAQQHVLPTTSPKVYPCDGQKAVAADGTLYGVTDADSTVAAYRAGAKLFGRTLAGASDCAASRLAVTKLSMGVGGKLWATAREANYNCPSQSYLFALSATSGAVQASVALGNSATRYLQATATGAVVLTGESGQGMLRYFTAAGTETTTQAVQLQAGEQLNYPRVVGAADGTVYLPAMREHSADAACRQGNLTTSVLVYGAGGKKGAYALPGCASIDHLAVGTWGAALYGMVGTGGTLNGVPAETLITISTTGAQLATGLPKNNVGGSNFISGAARVLADAAGNLVVLRKFTHSTGYDDTLVQVIEPTNGTVRQEFTTESFAGSAGFLLQDAALGRGYLYLLGSRCEGNASTNACPGQTSLELHGIAVGGLELEAPFGSLLLATSQPAAELEFAFAGDSFISGEGVKPFGPTSEAEQCHRSKKAWPVLADLDARLSIKIPASDEGSGFAACSGARTTEIRSDVPDESRKDNHPVQVSRLKSLDGVKRVVISIGGNDVGFSDQLKACIYGKCSDREAETNRLLRNALPGNLAKLIQDLKTNLGDDVQLYFMGYPQVLPAKKCSAMKISGQVIETMAKGLILYGLSWKQGAGLRYLAASLGVSPLQLARQILSGSLTFSDQEAKFATDLTNRLNGTIQTAVVAQGARFINPNYTGSPFAGGHLCPVKGRKQLFNGLHVDSNPARVKENMAMSFHPNEAGAKAYLEVFRQYLAKHPQK